MAAELGHSSEGTAAGVFVILGGPTGVPGSLLRIDLAGMRQAGYEIPGITPVGRSFNMPGGGFEMQFPYPVPPQLVSVIRP